MKPNFIPIVSSLAGCLLASHVTAQDAASLVIEAGTPHPKVSPMHYGLMTEEINYCYDGGLYAELVRNRAFLDDAEKPTHWSATPGALISLDPKVPLNAAIPTSLRVDVATAPGGVSNDGYWGIPVKPETCYRAHFHAKAAAGFAGPVTVAIVSSDGATVFAQAATPDLSTEGKSYELELTTGQVAPTTKANLVVTLNQPGTVWLGLVSLFPPTWKDRPNGLRPDLMQMLVDLSASPGETIWRAKPSRRALTGKRPSVRSAATAARGATARRTAWG